MGQTNADVDLEGIRRRYAAERDKRLRADGNDQYVDAVGEFDHFGTDDPHAGELIARDAIDEEVDVLVIGGGHGGIMQAVRLLERGVKSVRIVETASDFGGTWYWNRYPGAQCDIESYIYLPLLEETGYIPKEKYSFGPEIQEHAQRVAKRYGLYDLALLRTRVTELRWDEASSRYIAPTDRGDVIRARFVVCCLGVPRPKLPGITGLQDFKGTMFHSSRWDYGYTGGDVYGNLHKLADKKVAVIGTGASAVQIVPHLGRDAQHLYVFQRTPSSVDERRNKPTDPAWVESLEPGWQQHRSDNFNTAVSGMPVDEDLVDDCWSNIRQYGGLGAIEPAQLFRMSMEDILEVDELADHRKMIEIRERVARTVTDPATAEALKPYYRRLCKRPTFNDDYLPTFNRPNVTLVDTSASRGVERITETGLMANGLHYEADLIVFATGFEVSTSKRYRADLSIKGRNGLDLWDAWKGEGYVTFHGHSTPGFPNWFLTGINQNALSPNYTSNLAGQTHHIAYIVAETLSRGALTVEAKPDAARAWAKTCRRLSEPAISFFDQCTPGYYNNEGKDEGLTAAVYQPGAIAFRTVLQQWRDKGRFDGMTLSYQ